MNIITVLIKILHKLDALLTQGAHMSDTVSALQVEVAKIEADLSSIQTAVSGALASNTAQAQVIADQKSQIDALKAEKASGAQQLADLKAATDAVVVHADEVAASLSPVAPPVVPTV